MNGVPRDSQGRVAVTGEVTIDPAGSGLATAAGQGDIVTTLETISDQLPVALGSGGGLKLDARVLPPGSHTPLTPSDSTDITAVTTIGFLVTADGTIAYRGATTTSTTVTHAVTAGQYIYGAFSRLMAATTATVVGLAP